jgi:hypothetical protein
VKIDVINELVNDIAAKGKSSYIPKALAALLQEQPTSALATAAPTVNLVTQLINQLLINQLEGMRKREEEL